MPENDPPPDRAPTAVPFELETPCESCGKFGAYRLGDRALCGDCISGSGSCCPEFGKDDLWKDREL